MAYILADRRYKELAGPRTTPVIATAIIIRRTVNRTRGSLIAGDSGAVKSGYTRPEAAEGIHSGSAGRGVLTTAWNPAPSSTNGPPGDAGDRSTPWSATATWSAPCSAICLSSLR